MLANAVDDITQGITHVVRGEEHLGNAAKQELLWPALGANPPVWAHLPVIVNEQRKKLSKRRDKVALEDYRAEGYLAEAMVNYLMLLGWGPGDDREIMPWSEMVPLFKLENVNSSSAFFDEKKLRAFNGEYIRALPVETFEERCPPYSSRRLGPRACSARSRCWRRPDHGAVGDRQNVDFLFLDEPVFDQASWDKAMKNSPEEILTGYLARLDTVSWDPESLKGPWRRSAPPTGSSSARPRRPCAWRSPAGRWACRCSSRSRCSAANVPRSGSARRWPASRAGRRTGGTQGWRQRRTPEPGCWSEEAAALQERLDARLAAAEVAEGGQRVELPPLTAARARKWSPFARSSPPFSLNHSTLSASSTSLQM